MASPSLFGNDVLNALLIAENQTSNRFRFKVGLAVPLSSGLEKAMTSFGLTAFWIRHYTKVHGQAASLSLPTGIPGWGWMAHFYLSRCIRLGDFSIPISNYREKNQSLLSWRYIGEGTI